MKPFLIPALALVCAGSLALAGGGGAPPAAPAPVLNKEITVPGTKVSYVLSREDGMNASSVFVESSSSPNSFVEFTCVEGAPMFFLTVDRTFLTQEAYDDDRMPALTYRVDAQPARTLSTVGLNESDEPGDESHLNTLAVEDENDAVIFAAFRSAVSKVNLSFTAVDGRAVNLSFPMQGFAAGVKALNGCR